MTERFFYGLSLTGLQADEAVVDLYERLGIETPIQRGGGVSSSEADHRCC